MAENSGCCSWSQAHCCPSTRSQSSCRMAFGVYSVRRPARCLNWRRRLMVGKDGQRTNKEDSILRCC
ncbi:hypothetical protein LY76DRAFT_187467 [Colletotrichum caudatum]|nr:hypothetical protein LY76DRAFT_187467 [Colletotrichum caudatum]